jgi:hypothetical protein
MVALCTLRMGADAVAQFVSYPPAAPLASSLLILDTLAS